MTQPRPLILVVDDEPLVRFVAADALEDGGFAVTEAANAENALKVLEARCDVQLLFTDIQMPGAMDGLELVRLVHGRWPKVRIIITSGRLQPNAADLAANDCFLSKPYRGGELLARVLGLIG
jgi:CheY-like chemotaxis protein